MLRSLVGSEMCIRDRCGTYRLRFSFNSPSSSVGTPTPLRAGTHVRATLPASEGSQGSSSYLGGLQVFHVAYFTFQRLRYPVASVSLTQLGVPQSVVCLLYTSDAADEEDSVDLGGRRIIKKKKNKNNANVRQ
eukprot:TRINITY_DN19502_c0_g1_i3.p1 TRINITY_DN19502_c0_g1~~TRINITY_DN19502_c0_g1_i3.p1  ORF type:complete len:133 (-),score=36.36 TRINITY_DN19502_c0_g1_i3:75-473(-)